MEVGADMDGPSPPASEIDWAPLIEWAARTEGTGDFGHWVPAEERPDGVLALGWVELSAQGTQFLHLAAQAQVVSPFDYTTWMTQRGHEFSEDPDRIAAASLDECRNLLVVVIRGDRFAEGLTLEGLDKGVVHRVLSRIAVLTQERK